MSESADKQLGSAALEEVLRRLERAAMGQGAKTRELTATLEGERRARERLQREAQDLVRRLREIAHDLGQEESAVKAQTETAAETGSETRSEKASETELETEGKGKTL